jgi:hypothetical protein
MMDGLAMPAGLPYRKKDTLARHLLYVDRSWGLLE